MYIPNLYFSAAHHNSTNLFYSHLLAMNSSCSIHSEFQCGNGECIDYQLTCDGIAHCKDRADEKMQYCGKNPIRLGAVFEPSGFISKLNEGIYLSIYCICLSVCPSIQGLKLTPANPPNAVKNQLGRGTLSNQLPIWRVTH